MAQFTTQGRLKALFNGDGVFEARDPSRRFKLVSASNGNASVTGRRPRFAYHKRKLRIYGSSTLPDSSSSSSSSFTNYNPLSASSRLSLGEDGIYDDLFDFEMDDLCCFRGLVLDISYRPINVVCWKRAICLEFSEKADVLEYYDQTVNSPSGSFYIPAVLRIPHLLQVVKRRRIKNTLSRRNILYRDNFTCQYCSSRENLTIDHVLPIARGGEWKWENLVTACASCNSQKGPKILEETNMKLMRSPKAPKDYDIVAIPLTNTAIKMLRMRKGTPVEWLQYIPNPSSEA